MTRKSDTADEKPPTADWPEHPFDPAMPQTELAAESSPGAVKVRANVAVLGMEAGQTAMVYEHPEVDALLANGLLEKVEDEKVAAEED